MSADRKLLKRLGDPQAWISFIAVVTVLGLCSGAFEPGERAQHGRALVAQSAPADTLLASAEQAKP